MAIYGVDFLGSEYYGVPKFSDFDATPFLAEPLGYAALRLTWATPSGSWDILRVVRNSYGTPDWEDDGTVIGEYTEPSTNEIFDEDLSGGRFYYYSIFVREASNQRWHRAATALGLTANEHGNADSFFNWLPGWFREQDNDLGNRSGLRRGDGPLKKYLKITGLAADFVRTEYESLRWTRDPDRISGNLLPMLGNQFGVPHEPALGMRRTRFWVRDAVFLYRRKGTLPGIQAIVTTITGWDSRVKYDRNLLKGVNADAWYPIIGSIADDAPNSDFDTGDLQTVITPTNGEWRVSNVPTVVAEGQMAPLNHNVTITPQEVAYHATPVEEGILYASTAEFLATVTGAVTPRLVWFAADGTELGEAVGDVINPFATDWVGSYVAGIAPAGAAHVAVRYDGNVSTRFRRASLEREEATPGWVPPMSLDIALVPVRTNYVMNPSFEYDLRTWLYSGDGNWENTGEGAYSGLRSLSARGRYEPVTLTGGPYPISEGDQWHVFSTYFRGENVTGEVRVRWLNVAGGVIHTSPWSQVFEGTSTTAWTRAWIADFAPAGAYSAEVELQLNPPTVSRDPDGLAFDGTAGSYATVPDTNLLDTVQASFDNVPFAGTVTPEDRYEIWGSGGGTGAGAPGAASPMLIDLEKLKTDDRHLFSPRTRAYPNFAAIPDVNLFDANQAHNERVAGWAVSSEAAGTRDLSTDVSPLFGTKTLKYTAGANAPDTSVVLFVSGVPAMATNQQYTVSCRVWLSAGWRGDSISIADDGTMSDRVSNSQTNASGTVTGQWQTLSWTFTTGTDVSASFVIRANGGAMQAGDVLYFDAFCLRTGTDAAFLPSTRTLDVFTLDVDMTMESIAHDTAQRGIWGNDRTIVALTRNGDTDFILYHYDGSVTTSWQSAVHGIAMGERVQVRVRYENGVVGFYKRAPGTTAWTQIGTNVTKTHPATGFFYTGGLKFFAGNYWTHRAPGMLYSWELRDGVDGPIVASYNFANAERGQTALTTPEGHALTINQSNVIGSGRAEIRGGTPKKAGWLPGAAGNYFSVPDTNLLSNKQSVFSGIPTGTALTPNQTEVWGTGGGTAAGAPGASSPMLIDLIGYGVDRALWLPGANGNFTETAHHVAVNITGDIDIRVRAALKDWTPATDQRLISKRDAATGYSWVLWVSANGTIGFQWWDGAAHVSAKSTVAPTVADRQPLFIRATLDVNNGAATPVWETKFYTSTDGVTWTQLGTTVAGAATTSVASSTAPIRVGVQYTGGTEGPLQGVVLRAQVRDGIDGPIVYDEDFSAARWAGNPNKATHAAALPAKHTAFTRSSTANLDGVEVASGVPRYPYGRNLLTRGRSQVRDSADLATLQVVNATAEILPDGGVVATWNGTTTYLDYRFHVPTTHPGTYLPAGTYTFRSWVVGPSGASLGLYPVDSVTGAQFDSTVFFTGTGTEQQMTATVTLTQGRYVSMYHRLNNPTTGQSLTLLRSQVEQGSAATPWRPGGPSAVLIEEGTTNLVASDNAAGESGLESVNAGTITYDTATKWQGTASARVSVSTATPGQWRVQTVGGASRMAVTADTVYTVSAYVRTSVAHDLQLLVDWYDSGGLRITATWQTAVAITAGTWTRLVWTVTSPTNAASLQIGVGTSTVPTASVDVWVDGLQVEAKGYATSWHPGGATRNAEFVRPAPAVVSAAEGTIELDVALNAGNVSHNRIFELKRGTGVNGILLYAPGGGSTSHVLHVTSDDGTAGYSASFDAGPGIHRHAVTWGAGVARWYVDGVLRGEVTRALPAEIVEVSIGHSTGGSGHGNHTFDAVRISNRARTATELTDATAPLTADEGTTYLNTFDGDLEGEWGATSTINRSGDATAEIVEKNTWAATGVESLYITHRAELDMALNTFAIASSASTRATAQFRNLMRKRDDSTLDGWVLDTRAPSAGGGTTFGGAFDGTSNNRVYLGASPTSDGAFHTAVVHRTSTGPRLFVDDATADFSDTVDSGTLTSDDPLTLLAGTSGSGWAGFGSWFVVLRRELTTAELTELTAWDGSIATEPRWLRSAAVFYVNAADPAVISAYANNEVVNLAAKPSNEFGWNAWKYGTGTFSMAAQGNVGTGTPQFGDRLLSGAIGNADPTYGVFTTKPVGPVTVGQTYTASFDVWSNSGAGGNIISAALVWHDATGGEIGRTGEASTAPGPASTWRRGSTAAGVAPAGAVSVSVYVRTLYYWVTYGFDRVIIRQGTATDFVPTHRITGDLDLRAKVALKDWTPTVNQALAGKWSNTAVGDYLLFLHSSGKLGFNSSPNGSSWGTEILSTVTVPIADRLVGYARVTVDVDNGAGGYDVKFFTSTDGVTWSQLGATVTIAGVRVINPGKSALQFGVFGASNSPLTGVHQSAEVRDGIDGPIVARFDADDPAGLPAGAANGASYTDVTTGHAVVLNANGNATTEIVDRNTWASSGDHLRLPDRNELDLVAGSSIEFHVNVLSRASTGFARLLRKGDPAGIAPYHGWGMHLANADRRLQVIVGDADARVYGPSHTHDAGVFSNIGGLFDGSTKNMHAILETTVSGAISYSTLTDTESSGDLLFGELAGLYQWVAIFRRALTTTERAALAAWDGKVATEPVWLRPLSVFYTNADDSLVRASYANNEVLNLGSAAYGELGWHVIDDPAQPDAVTNLIRAGSTEGGGLAPTVGSMWLQVDHGPTPSPIAYPQYTRRIGTSPVGPVTANQTYSASVQVATNSLGTVSIVPTLVWYDAADGEIGRVDGASQSTVPRTDSTRISVSGTAPTGAAKVGLELTWARDHSWNVYIDAAIIRQGADTGYVPSLRVRHDLDLRVEAALADWTPVAQMGLVAKATSWGDAAFYLRINVDGKVGLVWTPNGSSAAALAATSTVPIPIADTEKTYIRATLHADNGASGYTVRFYTSTDGGVTESQLGADVTVSGVTSIHPSAQPVRLGEFVGTGQLTGTIYSFSIRDGINGPVVLDADFTAAPWVEQDRAPTTKDDVTLVGPGVHIQSALFQALVDAAMLEESDYPGEYFDGSRFGADYIWGGDAHISTSRHYPGRTARNARLREILPDYLPIGQMFNLRFTEEAELGGRAAGYGAIGVGGTGRMSLGE